MNSSFRPNPLLIYVLRRPSLCMFGTGRRKNEVQIFEQSEQVTCWARFLEATNLDSGCTIQLLAVTAGVCLEAA